MNEMKNFTYAQLDKLADILINIGTVLFASVVVPFFVRIYQIADFVFYGGLLLTFICWFFTIVIARRIKR